MGALLLIAVLAYVQQSTDLLHYITEKYFICMCVPLLVGICQNKVPFGIWTSPIHYRKRGAVLGLMENNAKREVTLTFPPCLLCVYNKTVSEARDVGLVLF